MNQAKKAEQIARQAHKKQKRRSGVPYITHAEAVVQYLIKNYTELFPKDAYKGNWMDPEVKDCVIAAAWMHDVVEDTDWTIEMLKKEGFKPLTYELVDMLTRKKGETYFAFIMRIHNGGNPPNEPCGAFRVGATAIKLSDLWHNMTDSPSEGSRLDKYRFAKYILSYFNN